MLELDEGTIKNLMKKLDDHERRISALEGAPAKKTQVEGKKLSIKEFLLTKKPGDDVQRTLVIGYYLEYFESMDRFNARDLADGFRSAKEPLPTNINDKANSNVGKGHIMEAKEKKDKLKAWVLTNSGEKFVEEGLPEGE
jgi:hypothetical protein